MGSSKTYLEYNNVWITLAIVLKYIRLKLLFDETNSAKVIYRWYLCTNGKREMLNIAKSNITRRSQT